jgi:hypothetical protein
VRRVPCVRESASCDVRGTKLNHKEECRFGFFQGLNLIVAIVLAVILWRWSVQCDERVDVLENSVNRLERELRTAK